MTNYDIALRHFTLHTFKHNIYLNMFDFLIRTLSQNQMQLIILDRLNLHQPNYILA